MNLQLFRESHRVEMRRSRRLNLEGIAFALASVVVSMFFHNATLALFLIFADCVWYIRSDIALLIEAVKDEQE